MKARDHTLELFPEAALPVPATPSEAPTTSSEAPAAAGTTAAAASVAPRTQAASLRRPPRPDPLWLALDLPALALEAQAPAVRGVAVFEQRRVVAVDAAARRQGVHAGQSLDAALALAPALHCVPRRPRLEREALETLAATLSRYSSRVSVVAPDALLVEIGASLRLFGGRRALLRRVVHAAGDAYTLQPAVAATPTAALWLARGAGARHTGHRDAAPGYTPHADTQALSHLPLSVCRWPQRTVDALTGMGVHTLGDCLRLPRDGLARRFGPDCLDALDRALGRQPDPQPAWQGRTRLHAGLELPAETTALVQLGHVLERLLARLAAQLDAREAGITALRLTLHHLHHPATVVEHTLTVPSRDAGHCLSLLMHRLERTRLAAPVVALVLDSAPLVALPPDARADLFDDSGRSSGDTDGVPRLVERLRARLGTDAVYGLCPVDEHRPEAAWQRVEDVTTTRRETPAMPHPPRPLWMLDTPLALDVHDGRPQHEGALVLVRGPERIETGWWDGSDITRDYYVAVSRRGSRLWIYRERRDARGWYLHGIFG